MHSMASLPFRRSGSAPSEPRLPRRSSFTFPDRFRDDADAQTDVAAPRTKRGEYLNQSFLSMIANVGSNIAPELHVGLEESDSESKPPQVREKHGSRSVADLGVQPLPGDGNASSTNDTSERRGKRLFQSTSGIATQNGRGKRYHKSRLPLVKEDMSTSQILQPLGAAKSYTQAERNIEVSGEEEAQRGGDTDTQEQNESSDDRTQSSDSPSDDPVSDASDNALSRKVAQVYGLQAPEEIISDFPCWLVQSIVVQGRLYITPYHVCFYAFLPRRTGTITKSGFFFKRGPRNPRFNRYWFVLRGNVLSYYKSASNLYFPQGTIDLRSALSAQLEEAADDASGRGFSITTSQQTLRFKAESVTSAQEWTKKIQRSIFHSRNAGNTVKTCLPIRNMLEIEDNAMFENWNTLRIKIVDSETFAVDEYFFSFLNNDNNALETVRTAIACYRSANVSTDQTAGLAGGYSTTLSKQTTGGVEHPVLGDDNDDKAKSTTQYRRSIIDNTLDDNTKSSDPHLLSDESFDEVASSSATDTSDNEGHGGRSISGSRILKGSDVFHHSRITSQSLGKQASASIGSWSQPEGGLASIGQSLKSSAEARAAEPDRMIDSTDTIQPSATSSKIESFMRAGGASLQKASGIAEVLQGHSKRVGARLANESKVYYEKVTNMWTGKTMHFNDTEMPGAESAMEDSQEQLPESTHGDRFRAHFALEDAEKLQATYHGILLSGVPVYGKFYLSDRKLCFRTLVPGTRTKMILPLRDIITVDKAKGFNFGYHGLVIIVNGYEELFLEFARPEARDDLAVILQKRLSAPSQIGDSRVMDQIEEQDMEEARSEFESLENARHKKRTTSDSMFESIAIDDEEETSPVIFDDMNASFVDFKPPKALRVVCLTIGSRGDVQPYIALCKGLIEEGHKPLIATHAEFEPWIRKHGIDFAPVAGNPAEIMQLCVENDTFTMNFFKEVATKMRPWFDALLQTSWEACQGADVLIESPSAMAGVHIAQALGIPYFRAFSMMWTRTRAYPHPFVTPKQKLGGNYNYLTYVIVDKLLWQAGAYQINRWRTKTLKLPPTGLERLKLNSVPFLYNFSPSLVARPLDFSPWIHVTGNWFLDESTGWEPPEELQTFIDKAHADGKKLVYVGFGSMVVENRAAMTKTIVDSVLKADVRCIFSKGWSDRLQGPYDSAEIRIPDELIVIKSAPHDWLFEHIDAAVHHGGAGTTAASLRAGVPTIVRPFFGDQKFYGARVEDLGVGRCLDKFNTSSFSRALWEATHNERIIDKARVLGEKIRAENGVPIAIQAIYRDLEYAKSLIKHQNQSIHEDDENDDVSVQDWTMVDEDADEAVE